MPQKHLYEKQYKRSYTPCNKQLFLIAELFYDQLGFFEFIDFGKNIFKDIFAGCPKIFSPGRIGDFLQRNRMFLLSGLPSRE